MLLFNLSWGPEHWSLCKKLQTTFLLMQSMPTWCWIGIKEDLSMKLPQIGHYQWLGKRQLKQPLQVLHLLLTPTLFRSLFPCQDALQRNCTSVFRKRVVNLATKPTYKYRIWLQHQWYNMSTSLILPWMHKVLQLELKGASLLLLDSWSGQTRLSARAFGKRELNLHTKIVPPKTTKYCQPLRRLLLLPVKTICTTHWRKHTLRWWECHQAAW